MQYEYDLQEKKCKNPNWRFIYEEKDLSLHQNFGEINGHIHVLC